MRRPLEVCCHIRTTPTTTVPETFLPQHEPAPQATLTTTHTDIMGDAPAPGAPGTPAPGAPVNEPPPLGPDGECVGGPRGPQQIAAQRRLQQTQAQVDEVVDIMRTNVEKVLERDQKLSELDDRADALQQGAAQFEQQAGSLKNKMFWKNVKMMIIMGVIGLIVIIIIAGPYFTGGDKAAENAVVVQQPIQPQPQQPVIQQQPVVAAIPNNAPHSLQ
ncbi:unnamed protein product [Meganyctiphanes norvegica]|uniref:V-SNARE coiled-coil homology domain-containing protein n=1 Tax=Meganyctiphanes norvegica TaxID=48144 RepID=A0AAV2QJB2_MEGNR